MSDGGARGRGRRGARGSPAGWIALLFVAGWVAAPSPWWLLPVALLLVYSALRDPASHPRATGLALLLLVVPVALGAHRQLAELSARWDTIWEERADDVYGQLVRAFEDVAVESEGAVDRLASLAERTGGRPSVESVREIRDASPFDAVALYSPQGVLRVWDGMHRGRIPEEVRFGQAPYLYGELPLFSYLYVTAPVGSAGGTAVGTILLHSRLPEDLGAEAGDLATRLARRTGEAVRIRRSGAVEGDAAFDFVRAVGEGRDTLFSVEVVRPSAAERHGAIRDRWVGAVAAVALLAWILFAIDVRGRRRESAVAFLVLGGLLLIMPLRSLFGGGWLASSRADFVLPVPGGMTLETLGFLALVGVALGAIARGRSSRAPVAPPWIAAPVVVLLFPFLLHGIVERAAAPGLLAGAETGWVVLQGTLAMVLTVVVAALLGAVGGRGEGGGWRMVAALVGSAVLALLGALWVERIGALPVGLSVAWAFPVWAAASVRRDPGWKGSLLLWTVAGVIGTSAALPWAWSGRTEARLTIAEDQIERLGAEVDPHLHFLLSRLERSIRVAHDEGAPTVEMLYRGWVESGLSREPYPVWLTLWGDGVGPRDLRIGVTEPRPVRPVAARQAALEAEAGGVGTIERFTLPDLRYLLAVPLGDGSVVTAAVPPLRELGPSSPLGPLFSGLGGESRDPLTLVPLLEGDISVVGEELEWVVVDEGWQGELLLRYPEERYHAHYLVALPGTLVLIARATLLLVLNLGVLLAVWLGARTVGLRGKPRGAVLRPLVASFRARVTVALFGFFLVSIAIFGTLAYRTIAGAAERAASVLAERIAQDAAAIYFQEAGRMELLAREVQADLLEYREGQLREGSNEELVELGLFEAWIPFDVFRSLDEREEVVASRRTRLGRWEYVTAFRRLPDGDILATPLPLRAGATAVRREEVAHLIGFAIVVGAVLSFVLALTVGRALARPIRTLQSASERVGRGDLEIRLPVDRADEFGSVFDAFNRMVRRLRRARRDLVRTSNRTQAIVEGAATGVIALDASARVTLANARAADLLGRRIETGERLGERGEPADEFVQWVELYFRDRLDESGREFHLDDRRLRARARRISRDGSLGGAVVSLEDVTDELRTERVLAWGTMARQVAHEVKNPLTPIKLAIQHIRRAWEDRRPEFDEILQRNTVAALDEIDRLAGIASSFARFGAPQMAGEAPVTAVSIPDVVGEVLALYDTGAGGVRFERELADDLVPVRARVSELKEVLINLFENARAAVSADGRVCVEAYREEGRTVLAVRDDGAGISEDVLPRIFEPQFSTRSAGAGLGLAIVKQLVESWDGAVSVDSVPGEGTAVRIVLQEA